LLNKTKVKCLCLSLYRHRVLALSGGIEEIGKINWEILLCLIAMWIVCYFCIWKGVKSTGKVCKIFTLFIDYFP